MKHYNPLLLSISSWFKRNFSDPAAVGLFFTIVFLFLFLEFFGHFFLPVIISIVLAYLLLSVVRFLERCYVPHFLAVIIVFLLFIGLVGFGLFFLLPEIVRQLQNLIIESPGAFSSTQNWLHQMMQKYPTVFSDAHLQQSIVFLQQQISHMGQLVLKYLWTLIPNIITAVLYFILVPLLLFFFLKDSRAIMSWFTRFLPKHRSLVTTVGLKINQKIGCYVRGRVIEIIVIAIISAIVFFILKMQYAILLGVLVGLSVIIPYIGAVIVTIPVCIVALMQWGMSPHFFYLLIAYAGIITFDANVLMPMLFSEAMDLHPIVIILSVLVFGGLWGFWGVFFAIPLATVGDVILRAWPDGNKKPHS